jgi:hypothetical protein
MVALTYTEFSASDYGYLNGADLLQFCPIQLLNSKYLINPNIIFNGVQMAYDELINNLCSKYNIENELSKSGQSPVSGSSFVPRVLMIVKITSILALTNILGVNKMIDDFNWAKANLMLLREGQMSLIGVEKQSCSIASSAHLVKDKFNQLG